MPRAIRKQVVVNATGDRVWAAWTTEAGVKTFFAPAAKIELHSGGAYEMYFMLEAEPGTRGSEGCSVTMVEPQRKLGFTWNFPPTLPTIRNARTQVSIELVPTNDGKTMVRLSQTGWGEGKDWDEGFQYFQRAWSLVLSRLQYRFESGPIDWNKPYVPAELEP